MTNTFFQKPNENDCANKEINTDGFKELWTPEMLNMLDVCLAPEIMENAIHDVESKPSAAISSDHAMLIAKVKLKMKCEKKEDKQGETVRYRKPTEDQLEHYNK